MMSRQNYNKLITEKRSEVDRTIYRCQHDDSSAGNEIVCFDVRENAYLPSGTEPQQRRNQYIFGVIDIIMFSHEHASR